MTSDIKDKQLKKRLTGLTRLLGTFLISQYIFQFINQLKHDLIFEDIGYPCADVYHKL